MNDKSPHILTILPVPSRVATVWILAGSAVLLTLTVGCGRGGDAQQREPISGSVSLDGEPLAEGYLVFEPKEGQPRQSGGMIEDGTFTVPKEAGPNPGKYSVAIFSGASTTTSAAAPGTPEAEAATRPSGERVPRRYNIDTTLEVDVQSGGDNNFTFELRTDE